VRVPAWSAPHIRALRMALRMTVRDFGPHVGVSARMVSKFVSAKAVFF
jgi:hypothetical protein